MPSEKRGLGTSCEGASPNDSHLTKRVNDKITHARQAENSRRRRLCDRVHRLGPGAFFYLLEDLESGGPVWPIMERYASLDEIAEIIETYGGALAPPPFLHAIDGGAP